MNIIVNIFSQLPYSWSLSLFASTPSSSLLAAEIVGGMASAPETYLTPRTADETEDRPYAKSVKVPEYIKRRIPSKHYVSSVLAMFCLVRVQR